MHYREITDDMMREAAREALTMPDHCVVWGEDSPLWNTHGCVLSWAEYGDDILSESNYLTALDMLNAAATEGTDETTSPDVIDATMGHALVGSLRQLFVRVYEDDGTTFKRAWREAVAIMDALRDYPVLDESDFSERELAAFDDTMRDALNDAARAFPDDDDPTRESYDRQVYEEVREQWSSPDEVSWSRVAEVYAKVRADDRHARGLSV